MPAAVNGLKECTKCHEIKAVSAFHKQKTAMDGFATHCKACRKQHYGSNQERFLDYARKYREENPELVKQTKKSYWRRNSKQLLKKHKDYRKNQPGGIYKIECIPTGRVYIGQSTMCPDRWRDHSARLRRGKHYNSALQADCDEYGIKAITFECIYEYPSNTSSDVLLEHEQRVINEYLAEGKEIYNASSS